MRIALLGILLLLLFSLVSCKKDKLTGEDEILEGNWIWRYTTYYDPWNNLDTIWPGDIYCIDFLERGIVKVYKNGEKQSRDRVVIHSRTPVWNGIEYIINLNNSATEQWYVKIYGPDHDTIQVNHLPYDRESNPVESYCNYYVRQ